MAQFWSGRGWMAQVDLLLHHGASLQLVPIVLGQMAESLLNGPQELPGRE